MASSRNRTLRVEEQEKKQLLAQCATKKSNMQLSDFTDNVFCEDVLELVDKLPERSVDLLFLDPPYNLTKSFGGSVFRQSTVEKYSAWMRTWFPRLLPALKPTASVYMCSDWRTSGIVQAIVSEHLIVRNRITWQREKGRGAQSNWKNCAEDIWFATVSEEYTFNVDKVKNRRKVIAPYKTKDGKPKDWEETDEGKYRLTFPSNLWNDITVPFWSMPENTEHPTQKPEKLVARVLLASTNEGDVVLDPFAGSGTTAVVCKKLGRTSIAIEVEPDYCALIQKRLQLTEPNSAIQGYNNGAFDSRNA